MKILIIEDSQPIRKLLIDILDKDGMEFQELNDGTEAEIYYSNFEPDWVLMDIAMGNCNGLTASKNILKKHPEAKIIIVTNYDEADFRETAKDIGVKEYVIKDNLLKIREIVTLYQHNYNRIKTIKKKEKYT